VTRSLLERILYAIAVAFAIVSLTFALIHLSGDPLSGLVPPGAPPETKARMRERFGLDRPLGVQYTRYLRHAVTGDFGESWRARRPAMGLVLDRMPATLRLAGASLVLALVAGVPLGLVAGSRAGGVTDLLASAFAFVGQAIPAFWLGTMLIALFAVRLRWLPSSGGDSGSALVLPAVALSLYPAAFLCRLLRASMSTTLADDYVRTARAKGLSERRVLLGHAARHAALPVLAFAGVQIGLLIGGAVVVEGVFAYPGVGQLTLHAVADRDLPVIQAATVVIGSCIVVASLAVDGIARLLDPRIAADHVPGAWT
jgi:peptide/nickel transport system permease protein